VGGNVIGVGVGGNVIAVGVGGKTIAVGVGGNVIAVGVGVEEVQAAAATLTAVSATNTTSRSRFWRFTPGKILIIVSAGLTLPVV
jgi:hypothetical protein